MATGRDTLRGLGGVEVLVEPLQEDLEAAGLSTAALGEDITRTLRAAGILVYGSQRENQEASQPYVYVHVNATGAGDGNVAVAIQLHLRQSLQLPVTGSRVVNAMTWDAHGLVVASRERIAGTVREELSRYVGRFTADWQSVR